MLVQKILAFPFLPLPLAAGARSAIGFATAGSVQPIPGSLRMVSTVPTFYALGYVDNGIAPIQTAEIPALTLTVFVVDVDAGDLLGATVDTSAGSGRAAPDLDDLGVFLGGWIDVVSGHWCHAYVQPQPTAEE